MQKRLALIDGILAMFLVAIFMIMSSFFKDAFYFPLFFEIVSFLLPSLIVVTYRNSLRQVFGNFFPSRKTLIKSILFLISASALGFSIGTILDRIFDFSEISQEMAKEIFRFNLFFQILIFTIIPPIAEEILFRGVLLRAFQSFKKIVNFLLVSILFTLFHTSLELFIPILILSFAITAIGFQKGGLLCAIFCHFLHNLITLIMFHFFNYDLSFTLILIIGIVAIPFYIFFLNGALRDEF